MRGSKIRTGRARLLLALLGCALVLPHAALAANHTSCTQGGSGQNASGQGTDPANPVCPEFSPDFIATVEKPFVDSPSQIVYRFSQADDESATVAAKFSIPKAWRFSVNSVRPGEKLDGTKANDPVLGSTVTCADMYDASSPRNLVRGEALSPEVGMRLRFGAARSVANYGNEGGPDGRKPNLSFLRWNPTTSTADLCMYLWTGEGVPVGAKDFILPVTLKQLTNDPTFGWTASINLDPIQRNTWFYGDGSAAQNLNQSLIDFYFGINGTTGGNWNRNAAGQLSQVVFSRTPVDPETTTMQIDLDTCRNGLRAPGSTPPAGQTDASCNDDFRVSVSGERDINIMLAPTVHYPHDFGHLSGPTRLPGTNGGMAVAGANFATEGFALVRGTNVAPVQWSQPGASVDGVRQLGPSYTVKGYVLVVSNTGDQDGRHFEYFQTQKFLTDADNHVMKDGSGASIPNPGFDAARHPCGDDGLGTCKFGLAFPLTGIGGTVLSGNGKYDLALITVYADGFRTDGLCDNGTAQGMICPPNQPGFLLSGSGISTWQFMMRRDSYANAYLEVAVFGPPCQLDLSNGTASNQSLPVVGPVGTGNNYQVCGDTGNANSRAYSVQPHFVLLVDYPTKRADFIVWGPNTVAMYNSNVPFIGGWRSVGNPQHGPGLDFAGSANTILGSGDNGVISYGNFKPDGSAPSFRYDGITNVINGQAVTPCAPFFIQFNQAFSTSRTPAPRAACGLFTLWYPNNWTLGQINNPLNPASPLSGTCIGITVPTCRPVAAEVLFQGAKI